MNDPSHPIWALLKFALTLAFLFGCMAFFAGDLKDMTEIYSLIAMATGLGGKQVWDRIQHGN